MAKKQRLCLMTVSTLAIVMYTFLGFHGGF